MKNQVTKNFSIVIDFTINANGETIATINNQAIKNDLLPEQTETKPAPTPTNAKLDDAIKNCPLYNNDIIDEHLTFGQKFAKFRNSLRLTQKKMAKKLNVTECYVAYVELGGVKNPLKLKQALIKTYSKQTLSKYFTFLG